MRSCLSSSQKRKRTLANTVKFASICGIVLYFEGKSNKSHCKLARSNYILYVRWCFNGFCCCFQMKEDTIFSVKLSVPVCFIHPHLLHVKVWNYVIHFLTCTGQCLKLTFKTSLQMKGSTPVLMCSVPGYDPSGRVDDLAAELGRQMTSIAIG